MEIKRIADIHFEDISVRHMRYATAHFCDGSAGKIHTSFGYILQGETHLETGHEILNLPTGSFFFLPAGTRYRSRWTGTPEIEYCMIHLTESGDSPLRFHPAHIPFLSVTKTGDRIRAIENMMEGTKTKQLRALSELFALLSDALPYLTPETDPTGSAILTAAVSYIRANFAQNYTVADLAAACHVSESHLHHVFKREWNISPTDYRNEIRLDLATKLLRRGDVSMETLLSATGYSSAIYFRELFKRYYGMTPTQYRREVSEKH